MQYCQFEQTDGSRVFINPLLVRKIVAADDETYVYFEKGDFVILKEVAKTVASNLAAYAKI